MAGESADNYVQANSPGVAADGGAICVFSNAASLDIKNSEFINNDAIGPEWWTVWPTT